MSDMKRRNFMKNAFLGASATIFATSLHAKLTTPKEMEGPFYPKTSQDDKDADLTRVKDKNGVAKGEHIEIFGKILDKNSNPIEGATIDIWQANSFGKYHHPDDKNNLPIDEHFQSWAIIQSDAESRFKFKTVMPGSYPLGVIPGVRTPHIHFKIGKNGTVVLTTQMYFPNHPLNAQDVLIRDKSAKETELMTAKNVGKTSAGITQYQFDIVVENI